MTGAWRRTNADFLRFARELIALRRRHPALRRRTFLDKGDVIWHGLLPYQPDFSTKSAALALILDGRRTGREPDRDFYMAFNASKDKAGFTIPPGPQQKRWRRAIDTALPAPQDIAGPDEGTVIAAGCCYILAPFALLVLIAEG